MKEFRLFDPKEWAAGALFTAVITVVFAMLLYAVRRRIGLLIFCTLSVVLLVGLLVFYVISVRKAVAVWDPQTKILEIRGYPSYRVDLSKAVLLQTVARKNGQVTNRVMVFTDEEDRTVATVATYFHARQGVMTEPFAREMAAQLGIAFRQNVPEWEFDKSKYQDHIRQVEAEEKAAAKARREARMKHRIEKRKQKLNGE